METWMWIIAGIPACYYGGLFWGTVLIRSVALTLVLIGFIAKLVADCSDWLVKLMGFEL
jgi:hypothetical protein